ncbi:MAG: flagellar hook-length control protein FliK [Blastopirellula sp. JB062]
METQDTKNVHATTLSLPPRTVGVVGTAPPDALTFINLIQQNTAGATKSPGAEASYVSSKPAGSAGDDRGGYADNDDFSSDRKRQDSSAIRDAGETDAHYSQALQESTNDTHAYHEEEEEEVIVADAKVATPNEDSADASREEAELSSAAERRSKTEATTEKFDDLVTQAAADEQEAGGEEESRAALEQPTVDAVAEASSAATDSEILQEAVDAAAKKAQEEETGQAVDDASDIPVEHAIDDRNDAEKSAERTERERLRQTQEAAAEAEQTSSDQGQSAAEQFAEERREASERRQEDSSRLDETNFEEVEVTVKAETAAATKETSPTPGTHAAVAASQQGAAANVATQTRTAIANNGDSAGQVEPTMATAIQRGLQRGFLQKATASNDAPALDTAKQIRLIQRVSQAVRTAQTQGGPIRLRLSPPELGSLKVEIQMEEGGMSAKLEAESEAVRKVLMENLPQLRDRLAELNVRVDSFDVSVGQNATPQDAGGTFADQQQSSPDRQSQEGGRKSPGAETASDETSLGETTGDGQINVMV